MPNDLTLYRVFPWLERASADEPGHALYVAPPQGYGRLDNPEHYLTLYASDQREGAVGEAFGNLAIWTEDLLDGPPSLPGSRRAIATFDASAATIINLDDPRTLVERELRPSRVVTRDRDVTQAWALQIHQEGEWSGIRWWSFHNPDWGSFGIWDLESMKLVEVIPLDDERPLVEEVANQMGRSWQS